MTYGKQPRRSIGSNVLILIKRPPRATAMHHYIQATAVNQVQITHLLKRTRSISSSSKSTKYASFVSFGKKNQFSLVQCIFPSVNFYFLIIPATKLINKNHIINFFKNTEHDITFYQCATLPIISRDNE